LLLCELVSVMPTLQIFAEPSVRLSVYVFVALSARSRITRVEILIGDLQSRIF
jgi:hypothetical protein